MTRQMTFRSDKEIIQTLRDDYNVIVSRKWFNRYLYLYCRATPMEFVTMEEGLQLIANDPKHFAYFIFGCRAEYVDKKRKETYLKANT